MKHIPIAFDTDFESDRVLPIHVGRLYIGSYIGRLMFTPKGSLCLVIDKRAVEEGNIILNDPPPEGLFGFTN